LSGGSVRGGKFSSPGQDFEVTAQITLEQAARGTELDINLNVPEYDETGMVRRVPRTFKARIAKGASEGQRLRLPGKGGKGLNGGRDGDLWLNIMLLPHLLFRPDGHDLYVDLPIAPWEAVLGASVEVPTLDGVVRLKVPGGTRAGQKLRLAGRGLPKPHGGEGDLYGVVQIVVPAHPSEHEIELYRKLAEGTTSDIRSHFKEAVK
jgi:curved DNA-binding protein